MLKLFSIILLLLIFIDVGYTGDYPAYACEGGECHVTSHAFKDAINKSEIIYTSPPQIEEFHFHVYFFQNNNLSVNAARWIQQQLIQKVINHEFLVVLVGINDTILPALNASAVPLFNMEPKGPHPCGSFEVWTAASYMHQVMSWFMMNRGEISVLLHPLTNNSVEDHTGRLMWLGTSYRIDHTILVGANDPPQYSELQLGYHYNSKSPYAPQNWLNDKVK
eukprot:549330_1